MNSRAILILLGLGIAGCFSRPSFTLTKEEILERAKSMPGEVYYSEGADGPYYEGIKFIGNMNTEGGFRLTTAASDQPEVSWPKDPDSFFEVSTFVNRSDEVFYLIRRVPNSERNTAEQGAAANP